MIKMDGTEYNFVEGVDYDSDPLLKKHDEGLDAFRIRMNELSKVFKVGLWMRVFLGPHDGGQEDGFIKNKSNGRRLLFDWQMSQSFKEHGVTGKVHIWERKFHHQYKFIIDGAADGLAFRTFWLKDVDRSEGKLITDQASLTPSKGKRVKDGKYLVTEYKEWSFSQGRGFLEYIKEVI